MTVPNICINKRSSVARTNRPVIKPSPIKHSHVARTGILTLEGTNPSVRTSMVLAARSCAGLRPGKNFSTPNQKKIIPRLTRNARTPWCAIQRVRDTSILNIQLFKSVICSLPISVQIRAWIFTVESSIALISKRCFTLISSLHQRRPELCRRVKSPRVTGFDYARQTDVGLVQPDVGVN